MINIKSKTHNAGALIAIFGALQMFLPEIQEFIPPDLYGAIFAGIGVAVVILRNMTTMPIDQK